MTTMQRSVAMAVCTLLTVPIVANWQAASPNAWEVNALNSPTELTTLANRAGTSQDRSSAHFVLTQEWGRARYRRCVLSAGYSGMFGTTSLWCTVNITPPIPDIGAERKLTPAEIALLRELSDRGDWHGGGHIGTGWGSSEGPFETLRASCCNRPEIAVLVTIGNPTFEGASPRRQLLDLLRAWHGELLKTAEETLRQKRRRRP